MGSSTRSDMEATNARLDNRSRAKSAHDIRDPTHTIVFSRGFNLRSCLHNGAQSSTIELVETGRVDTMSKHSVSSDFIQ